MNDVSVPGGRLNRKDLKPIHGLPLLLTVETKGLNSLKWAEEYQNEIRTLIETNGVVLIRGLKVPGSTQFGKILAILFGMKLLEYTYRSTPRTELRGNIYTATEYPASEVIPQHNENSYSRHWPNRIGFMCLQPAETGGETPISDSRIVYNLLPAAVREQFEQKGVMYVRNYSNLDLPWSVVFQTQEKSEVEKFCSSNEIKYQWLENDGLRTTQINPAIAVHPRTGEKLWFNQAHLFHVSSLGQQICETLLSSLGEENLPRNSYYGDGSPIEADSLAAIRDVYERVKVKFTWERNDLLVMDNMLFSHGRESYTGPRNVLVGMACPNC